MSNQQEMKQVSITEILREHSLVVPEIQREYVWGRNDYGILDTFLEDIKTAFNNKAEENPDINTLKNLFKNTTAEESKVLSSLMSRLSADSATSQMNIGFLYSYKPNYYVSDEGKDAYLIDGQQRFTTLFLVLYYLAIKENLQDDFINLFRVRDSENKIAFDYRVRAITHNFILDLVSNTSSVADLLNIKSKNWFLSNYGNDTTVKAIVGGIGIRGAFAIIHDHLNSVPNGLYEFAKNNVKFWHFKTEETSQGEELYITMNSRGQQLTDNETVRAILFKSVTAKENPMKWSELWEEWQDFFWKNSIKDSKMHVTADDGFNEFLRWVQIFKMVDLSEISVDDNEEAPGRKEILKTIQWGKWEKLDASFLTLEEIDHYFRALKYLYEDFYKYVQLPSQNYKSYSNFRLLNRQWLSPADNFKNIGQLEAFRLLPVLYYCKQRFEAGNKIDNEYLFRIIRFFFNLSKDPNIGKSPGVQVINAIKTISRIKILNDIAEIAKLKDVPVTLLSNEEKLKFELIRTSEDRYRTEDLFWKAEDIKVNNGQIMHLLDLTKSRSPKNSFDLLTFEKILQSFQELVDKEYAIWGNLLPTDIYKDKYDRVYRTDGWHKSVDFMTFVNERSQKLTESITDFFKFKKKAFVKKYVTNAELISESSFKKQMYLYFIIQTEIINNAPAWSWDNGRNFGAWANYSPYNSLFNNGIIFQQYNMVFKENESKLLWIHNKKNQKKDILMQLIEWSKN